jgi:hypothetical protein
MRHPEDAFFGVQFYPVGPQAVECDAQVVNQVIRLHGLYDYFVYLCLNSPPDVVSENMLHTLLVRSTHILEVKWYRYIAEHPKRSDEGGRKLVGLLHLYLVVPGIGIKET